MKKIISLLLCVLLVCALPAAALADEDPNCFSISGISVDAAVDGQNISLNFENLELVLAFIEDDNTFIVNIFDADRLLLSGTGKLEGNRLYFTVGGLSHTYCAEIDLEDSSAVPAISGFSLSEEQIQAIVEPLMAQLEISQHGTTTSFRLPHTATTQLLEQLLPLFEQIPTLDSDTLGELEGAIAQMKDTDSGIELNGVFTISDSTFSGVANVLVVNDGVAADAPVAYLDFEATVGSELSVKGDLNILVEDAYTQPFAFTLTIGDSVDFEMLAADATLHANFDIASSRLLLEFDQAETHIAFGATFGVSSDRELTVCPLGDLSEALDVQSLDEEQINILQTELSSAVSELLGSVLSVLMSAGLVG